MSFELSSIGTGRQVMLVDQVILNVREESEQVTEKTGKCSWASCRYFL